jgi:hypothetical protein
MSSKADQTLTNGAPGGGSSSGGNAAPPDPEQAEAPNTTPANAGIRFEDPATSTRGDGDGGVASDR